MISFPQSNLIGFPFTPALKAGSGDLSSVVSVRQLNDDGTLGDVLLVLPGAQLLSLGNGVTSLSVRDEMVLDDAHQPLLLCRFKVQDLVLYEFDGNRSLFQGWLLDDARAYIGDGGKAVEGDTHLLVPPVQKFGVRCPLRVQVELLFLKGVLPESKYYDASLMSPEEIALTVKIRNFMNDELLSVSDDDLEGVLREFWGSLSLDDLLYLDSLMSVDYLADSTNKRQVAFMSWLDDMLDVEDK